MDLHQDIEASQNYLSSQIIRLFYLKREATIEEIEKSAPLISANIATLGVATSSVLNPITKKNMFQLDDDQISYGIGIHGESGYKTENIHSSELLLMN